MNFSPTRIIFFSLIISIINTAFVDAKKNKLKTHMISRLAHNDLMQEKDNQIGILREEKNNLTKQVQTFQHNLTQSNDKLESLMDYVIKIEVPRLVRHQIEGLESRLFQFMRKPDVDIIEMRSWVENYVNSSASDSFSNELSEKFKRDEEIFLQEEEKEKTKKSKEKKDLLHRQFKGDQKAYNEYIEEMKKATTIVPPHIHAPFQMKLSNSFVTLVYLFQNSGADFAVELRKTFDSDVQGFLGYCLDIAYTYAVVSSSFHESIATPPIVPDININLILKILKKNYKIRSKSLLKNIEDFLKKLDFSSEQT